MTSISQIFSFAPARTLSTAVVFVGLLGCDSGSGTQTTNPAMASEGAYKELDITLPDLNDDDITLISQTNKDIHVLTFWAVWCAPCKAELAEIEPMWQRLKSRGLNVYAVSIDGPDTASQVSSYVQQAGWEFPVLLDRETQLFSRYVPKADVPFYIVLNADGEMIKNHQGYNKGDVQALEQYLDGLLPAAQ